MIKQSKKNTLQRQKLTVYPAVTKDQANRLFLDKLGKGTDNGANQHINDFLTIVARATCNGGSFTELDVLRESKSYNLEPTEIKTLLAQYVTVFERLGKISVVRGVYDYDTFVINS